MCKLNLHTNTLFKHITRCNPISSQCLVCVMREKNLEEQLRFIILMKFAQMCELPTDSAVTQTASSGDENQRGAGTEKRQPLRQKKKRKRKRKQEGGREVLCVYG